MAKFNGTESSGDALNTQTSNHSQTFLIATAIIGILFLANKLLLTNARDPREPPLISPKIPFIGHIINLFRHQAEYWLTLSKNVNLPIFEVNILGGRVYLISSPSLFQTIYRQPKLFSFDPLTGVAIEKIFQMPPSSIDKMKMAVPGFEDNEFPLHSATNRAMKNALTPGEASPILLMNARALGRLAKFMEEIDDKAKVVEMNRWLGDIFTISTSVGVFGPDCPIEKDFSLVKATEDFANSLGMLMIGVAPKYIAAKGYNAREAYTKAFSEYYKNGGASQASALIKERIATLCDIGGFTTDELASWDISIMLASSANSNPTLFWFLSYIYSNPTFLTTLREEISRAIRITDTSVTFDVSFLLKECPILVASWQEVLRTRAVTISSRFVMEDTLLADQYLLRKGGVIQLVSSTNHQSSQIWGPDAASFNPSRFLPPTTDNLPKAVKKDRRDGYTPFGGGSSLCPGRNFVTMEVIGAVALFVTGYEIEKEDGGLLEVAEIKENPFGAQIRQAKKDPRVKVRRRAEWAGKKWCFDVGDGVGEGSSGLAFNAALAQ